MTYINIIIIFVIIIILFLIINILLKTKSNDLIEKFCKLPKIDPQGGINDKRVLLDYPPQSDILTSSCDKYWKDWPMESNNNMVEDNPIVIKSNQLELPKEKQFANNSYAAGLIDFNKLALSINDVKDENIFKDSEELLIDPITKKPLQYKYELDFSYYELNKKSWINRWDIYNPSIKVYFDYNDIKSPIEAINILNHEFKKRCYVKQKELLTEKQLILFGLIDFQIFKYKILSIKYINNNLNNPIYIIEITLFRESDLYINTFSYVGYIGPSQQIFVNSTEEEYQPLNSSENKYVLANVEYIGRNSTDSVLLADFYNPNEMKQEIINSNFSNASVINKDPDAILEIRKKQQESYKLKNQYACFNINYDPKLKNEYILPYYSRESCESNYDPYGKQKAVGVYDTPCKIDTECPFFQINKNFENNFGKCMENGQCELPINMTKIGYHYYTNKKSEQPLCYNCNSEKFKISTVLDSCCEDQFDKSKYPFLDSPDYAFENDYLDRKNYFNNKFCTSKPNSLNINCKEVVI